MNEYTYDDTFNYFLDTLTEEQIDQYNFSDILRLYHEFLNNDLIYGYE